MPLTMPTINPYGSARNDLLDQLAEVDSLLTAAMEALRKARPHARDYPEGTGIWAQAQWAQAQREASNREACVKGVLNEIVSIRNHVRKQR